MAMVEQPRFRAGLDFLRLRAEAGEIDVALADWCACSEASDAERRTMLESVREPRGPRASSATPAPTSATSAAPPRTLTPRRDDAGDSVDPGERRR